MADIRETVPRYGEQPLEQTIAVAAAMRRLASLVVSLEHPHPAVDEMIDRFSAWEDELASALPRNNSPRIGPTATDTACRVYLEHASDIWSFNPCFPEYSIEFISDEISHGTVNFPVIYEGPPGLVHGGFLAVFFDCVIQHQNCLAGLSGKTRSLNVTFRRPTPVLTELRFDIARSEVDRGISSTARLLLDDEVLCVGEVNTLAQTPDKLTGFRFGKRRAEKT